MQHLHFRRDKKGDQREHSSLTVGLGKVFPSPVVDQLLGLESSHAVSMKLEEK